MLTTLTENKLYLPAPAAGSPDTEKIRTRQLIQVPHTYVAWVFDRSFTPRMLWTELGSAIKNDGRETELSTLYLHLGWWRYHCRNYMVFPTQGTHSLSKKDTRTALAAEP